MPSKKQRAVIDSLWTRHGAVATKIEQDRIERTKPAAPAPAPAAPVAEQRPSATIIRPAAFANVKPRPVDHVGLAIMDSTLQCSDAHWNRTIKVRGERVTVFRECGSDRGLLVMADRQGIHNHRDVVLPLVRGDIAKARAVAADLAANPIALLRDQRAHEQAKKSDGTAPAPSAPMPTPDSPGTGRTKRRA